MDSGALSQIGEATGGSISTRIRPEVEGLGDTGSSMSGSAGRIYYLLERASESRKKLIQLQEQEEKLRAELASDLNTYREDLPSLHSLRSPRAVGCAVGFEPGPLAFHEFRFPSHTV